MSTEQNKAQFRAVMEQFINAKNEPAFDEYVSPDFVEHEDLAPFPQNREGARQFFSAMLAAFPDMQITFHDMIAEGDKVAARSTWRGTHQGEFQGIPPTGKTVTFNALDIVRLDGGKVVEHWGLTDNLSMLQQLGVIPPSGPSES